MVATSYSIEYPIPAKVTQQNGFNATTNLSTVPNEQVLELLVRQNQRDARQRTAFCSCLGPIEAWKVTKPFVSISKQIVKKIVGSKYFTKDLPNCWIDRAISRKRSKSCLVCETGSDNQISNQVCSFWATFQFTFTRLHIL